MPKDTVERTKARRLTWVVFALLGTFALVLLVNGIAAAQAQQEEVDGCFGGALSDDPLHCEVLEWAHNEDVAEVGGVYRAGTSLYIFWKTDDPDEAALQKMLTKAQQVARRTGDYGCVLSQGLCDAGVLGTDSGQYFLPVPSAYQSIKFWPGGAEARRSFTGWRAFEQFWPEPEEGAGGATGTSGDFDISEVDRTNFPTLSGNCSGLINDPDIDNVCWTWDLIPSLDIANVTRNTSDGKFYYYVKVGSGEEELTKIAEAKRVLTNRQPDLFTEDNLVVVPVPHDFEELWRWSLILDRFANSSGNTLGIDKVDLGFNWLGGLGKDRKRVYPLEDAPDLTDYIDETGGFTDGSRTRLIIQVRTYEFDRTVAALPRLLKQLGIPESAVGLIYESQDSFYQVAYLLSETSTDGQPAENVDPSDSGTQVDDQFGTNADLTEAGGDSGFGPPFGWLWTGAAGALVAVLAGLAGLAFVKSRRAARSIQID